MFNRIFTIALVSVFFLNSCQHGSGIYPQQHTGPRNSSQKFDNDEPRSPEASDGALGNMLANVNRMNRDGIIQPGAVVCEPNRFPEGSPEEKQFSLMKGVSGPLNEESSERKMLKNAMHEVPESNVSHAAIEEAYAKYREMRAQGEIKRRTITIADCGKNQKTARALTINFETGQAFLLRHAYGTGTDVNGDGVPDGSRPFHVAAEKWAQTDHKTLLGFMKIGMASGYDGSKPNGLNLFGVERNLNGDAEAKAVRFHSDEKSGYYMSNGNDGRSWGCSVVAGVWGRPARQAMEGGLLYNYHPKIAQYRAYANGGRA